MKRFGTSWLARSRLLAALVAAVGLAALSMGPARAEDLFRLKFIYRMQLFDISKVKHASIVMLGDSLTEHGPWEELTGCRSLVNRGIGGDTTTGVLSRLDGVIKLAPRAVFLMIGINDLASGVPRQRTIENYRAILDRLSATDAHTFVVSVLPAVESYARERGLQDVPALNGAIADLVRERRNTTMVDLTPLVSDEGRHLRPELSYDGLHLNANGYAVWRDAIAPLIEQYCAP